MHLFKLDEAIHKIFKSKWKLDSEIPESEIPHFTPPKLWRLKFKNYFDNNTNELTLFDHPKHYIHSEIFQYDYGFFFYFAAFGSICLYKALRDLRRGSFKSALFFTGFSSFTFLEGIMISNRVRDPKTITLKDGKTLCIKTFQDGEMEYQMDIKDFRVVNKDTENLIILLDANSANDRVFRFFFIEPTPGCSYNLELLNTVLIDRRYLDYRV